MGSWPFIQARHYYPGRRRGARLIVVHDMEAPEGVHTAENVASWFAGPTAPQASAHFNCDKDSVVQSVKVGDTAWAAPNANADGIHIEHAGYARQSPAEWNADAGLLNISSCVAAELVVLMRFLKVDFQVRRLTLSEIAGGRVAGFCGHIDVTKAFHTIGGHTDPGYGFPWDAWLAKVEWWLPNIKERNYQ